MLGDGDALVSATAYAQTLYARPSTIKDMRTLVLLGILAVTLLLQQCGLMPPRRQYVKEANRQIVPADLLNTHWTLESWDNKVPDCRLTMDFYEKGRFTFKWNDLDFAGDNLW